MRMKFKHGSSLNNACHCTYCFANRHYTLDLTVAIMASRSRSIIGCQPRDSSFGLWGIIYRLRTQGGHGALRRFDIDIWDNLANLEDEVAMETYNGYLSNAIVKIFLTGRVVSIDKKERYFDLNSFSLCVKRKMVYSRPWRKSVSWVVASYKKTSLGILFTYQVQFKEKMSLLSLRNYTLY